MKCSASPPTLVTRSVTPSVLLPASRHIVRSILNGDWASVTRECRLRGAVPAIDGAVPRRRRCFAVEAELDSAVVARASRRWAAATAHPPLQRCSSKPRQSLRQAPGALDPGDRTATSPEGLDRDQGRQISRMSAPLLTNTRTRRWSFLRVRTFRPADTCSRLAWALRLLAPRSSVPATGPLR